MRKHDLQIRDPIRIKEMLASDNPTTVIDPVYKLEQVQEAHANVDKGHQRGNVVIKF